MSARDKGGQLEIEKLREASKAFRDKGDCEG
jgi:hypothetical protein